jgi:hypothetical protein
VSGAVVLCLALAAWPGQAGAPRFWPAVRTSRGTTVPVSSGITYSHFRLRTVAGPLSIHTLRVDLGNPAVHLGVSLARNQLISDDETVSSMVRRNGALAGVNGDYFDIHDSGMPLNIMVQGGRLLRSPSGWVALVIGRGGRTRIVRYQWAGSVVLPDTRDSYWLAGFNTGLVRDGIIALSNARGFGAPVPDPGQQQTVIELSPAPARDVSTTILGPRAGGTAIAARDDGRYTVKAIWPQQAYYAPFPRGEILLLGRGRAAGWLSRKIVSGMAVQVNLATIPDWHGVVGVIGGGPLLVQKGGFVDDPYSPVPGERDKPNPVTAIGLGRDGRTMLVTEIDGRQPRLSIGLTRPQLAAYMQWLGAYQAMEFDSGGSATMVVRLPGHAPAVVNSPSDGRERPVANSLLIYGTPVGGRARH